MAVPVAGCSSVLVRTRCYVSICQEGKTFKTFLESTAQHKSEGGQWKVPSGSPAEAEVLAWTVAAACCWRSRCPRGRDGTSPAPLGRCAAGISTA